MSTRQKKHYELYRQIAEQMRSLNEIAEQLENKGAVSGSILASQLERTIHRTEELESVQRAAGMCCAHSG